jgi:predicted nucleic acid-binding protein
MGKGFLMDTNVVIGYLSNQLPLAGASAIDQLPGVVSVITRIELLGWYKASATQLTKLKPLIDSAQIYNLSEDVIQQTILLRQQYKIKLPDAVVAATAMVYNHILITRNTIDFKNIARLDFENPWLW